MEYALSQEVFPAGLSPVAMDRLFAMVNKAASLQSTAATATLAAWIAEFDGVVKDVQLDLAVLPAAGESMVFDVRKNGSTILTATYTANNTLTVKRVGLGYLLTGTHSFVKGDLITVVRTYVAGGGPAMTASQVTIFPGFTRGWLFDKRKNKEKAMDFLKRIFGSPPKGGNERGGVPTTSLMQDPPAAQPTLQGAFTGGVNSARYSRVDPSSYNPGGVTAGNDQRNYDRGDFTPRRITHVREGDVAYEAEKARDLHSQVVDMRNNPPGPTGVGVAPVPTLNPPTAPYRNDGKPQPDGVEGKRELPELPGIFNPNLPGYPRELCRLFE